MTDICIVYSTVGTAEEAARIAETVVTEHLAACANILGAIQSVYYWQGQLQKDQEVTLLLKTTQSRSAELIARVKTLHSYECPAILVLPVAAGNDAFLKWVQAEVQ
jgi:periplasmic divalent cation tolerance protein